MRITGLHTQAALPVKKAPPTLPGQPEPPTILQMLPRMVQGMSPSGVSTC